MNYPEFQEKLCNLEKTEQRAFLNTLNKIRQMTWEDLYKDKGIRWELIGLPGKVKEYHPQFRFSKKYRAVACRKGNYLALLTLHPDHDSAYI